MNLLLWMFAAVVDWSIIVAAFAAVAHLADWSVAGCAVVVGAWLVVGNRQHALAILMHDGAHGSIAKSRGVNDTLARVFAAWPLGLPFAGYREFHLAHHARLNQPDDPEQVFKRAHPSYLGPRSKWRIAGDLVGDLCFLHLREIKTFVGMIDEGAESEVLALCLFQFQMLVLALVFELACWWWLLPLWFGSFVSVAWAHNRLRIWLEHSAAPQVETHRIRLPWLLDVVLRPHRVGLHAEHHRKPKVAWWRLTHK